MKLTGSNIISREKISALIHRWLNYVHFTHELESIYRQQYCEEAAYEFRYRGFIILILYLFLSYGIYKTIPNSQTAMHWFGLYAWVGVIILVAWGFVFYKEFKPPFRHLYDTRFCRCCRDLIYGYYHDWRQE